MPTTPMKNNLYRLGLILFAPSVATQQVLFRYREDETLPLSPDYGPGRLFKRHHMLGGTLLLDDGSETVIEEKEASYFKLCDDEDLF